MEIVALNEELRREFSPVLKLLRPPPPPASTPLPCVSGKNQPEVAARSKASVSVKPTESAAAVAATDPVPSSSSSAPSVEAFDAPAPLSDSPTDDANAIAAPGLPEKTAGAPQQQLVRIDRFKQHCLTVVHRLNTYQYGTKQAFCQEIAQLLLVARTPEQQQELQRLSERVANVQTREADSETQAYGSLEFDTSASIPGLQEVDGDTSSSAKKWLCNVNIKGHSIPIGTYLTRENALKAYELFRFDRSTSRGGTASVYKLAERLAIGQRESDEKVLQAAMDKCHSHVSWQRLQDMISLSTTPGLSSGDQAPGGTAAPHQTRDKEVRDPSHQQNALSTPSKVSQRGVSSPSTGSSSHHTLLFSPTTGLAPPSSAASSSTSSTSVVTAKGKNAKKRKKSADRLSHLRLRRLIQKRLCPHLKGKEVCVMRRPESVHLEDKAAWVATGRLESGKVFSYKYEKLVTFADYVADGMRNPVSACPHIFLVKTKESIDDHLLVCDTFSDAERLQLGQDYSGSIQNYMKSPEPKASRRR